ncbi:MAG: hypothetical protein AAGI37_21575 [Planctomycetota bacterium]
MSRRSMCPIGIHSELPFRSHRRYRAYAGANSGLPVDNDSREGPVVPKNNPGHRVEHTIVHVGPAKTATTYIQDTLYKNHQILADRGFLYPSYARSQIYLKPYFTQRFSDINITRKKPDPETYVAEAWQSLQDQLASRRPHTLILSAENLAAGSEALMRALERYLREISRTTTIVVTVRNPLDQAISRAQEFTKGGRISLSDLDEELTIFDYAKTLPKWQTIFGAENLKTINIEKSRNVVDDFLHLIGFFDVDLIEYSTKKNSSMSLAGMTISEIIRAERSTQFMFSKDLKILRRIRGPKYFPGASALRRVSKDYDRQIKYLKNDFNLDVGERNLEPIETEIFDEDAIRSIAEIFDDLLRVRRRRRLEAKAMKDAGEVPDIDTLPDA